MIDFNREEIRIKKNKCIAMALCFACICIQGCSSNSTKEVKVKSDSSEVLESERLKLNLRIQPIDSATLSDSQIGDLSKMITVQVLGQSSPGTGI